MGVKRTAARVPWRMFWPLLATVAVIAAVGILLYRAQSARIKREAQNDLAVIADMKSNEVGDWLRERMGDAEVLAKSPLLARNVARWLSGPASPEAGLHTRTRLESMMAYDAYQTIILADLRGAARMVVGRDHVQLLGTGTRDYLLATVRRGQTVFSDFYRCDTDHEVHLDIFAPLRDGERVTAAVILRIDPDRFLFPLIQSWPLPRKSAETLIVRRDGDDALFLNELRHRSGTAMSLRVPLTDTLVPAAMAALGKEGMVEGKDYRGVPVLAAIRRIPGSSWSMVAKVDQAEVYRPVRRAALMIGASCLLLMALAGAMIGLAWQRRQKDLYRRLHQAEQDRKALASHFEHVVKYANDIIVMADDDLRLVEVNDRAVESYGYGRDELLGMAVAALRPKPLRRQLDEQLGRVRNAGSLLYETLHQRRDGEVFPIEVSARFLDIEGKRYFQAIIRDISERKKAEAEISSRNRALQLLHECSLELASLPEGVSVGETLTDWLKELTGGYAVTYGEYDRERKQIALRRILIEPGALARIETAIGKRLLDVRSPVSPEQYRRMLEELVGARKSLHDISFGAIPSLISTTIGVMLGLDRFVALVYQTEGVLYGTSVIALKKGQPEPDHGMLKAFGALGAVSLRRAQAEDKLQTAHEELQASYEEIEANNQQLAANNEELVAAEEELKQKNEELQTAEEELRKQLEELEGRNRTIEERERDFRLLVENAPDAIFIQTDRRFAFANPRCLRLFGAASPGQLVGTPVLDRVQPDSRDMVAGRIAALNEQQQEVPAVQYEMLTLSGTPVPVEVSAVPFSYQGAAGALVFVRDIAERKRAEENLRLSEEKFAKSFRGNAALMAITRLEDSRFVDVNERWIERMGYSREEAVGRTSAELGIWTSGDDHAGFIAALLRHGSVGPVEYLFRKKGGIEWTGLVSSQVTNVGGQRVIISSIIDISDRKRAEQALQLANTRLRAFIDANIVGVVVAEAGGRIVETNDYYLRMIGYSREEFERGLVDWRSITPPEWLPADEQAIRELRERGACTPYEKEYQRRDGSRVAVYLADALLPGPGEQIAAFAVDLTERKRAEETLRRSEEENRAIVNAVPDILFRVDAMGTILDYRAAEQAALYIPPEEFMGKNVADVLPADVSEKIRAAIHEIKVGGAQSLIEYSLDMANGRQYFECRMVPLAGGQLLAVVREITARKLAEERIRTSERLLNRIIDESPFAMWLSDARGTLIRLNKACCDILHIDPDEVVGKYNVLDDSIVRDQGHLPLIRTVFEQGLTVRFDLVYDTSRLTNVRLQRNVALVLDVTIFPIVDERGTVTNAVIQHVDITERKRSEQKIRQQLSELQEMYDAMLGREDRVRELKEEVNRLLGRQGIEPKYLN